MLRAIGVLFVSLSLFACSSTTMIRTNDKDVKIYADGSYLGKGAVSYTDTKIVGSSTQIMLKKKGCQPITRNLNRTEKFDVGACAGGMFVGVPFLWIMGYNPNHNYDFECEAN